MGCEVPWVLRASVEHWSSILLPVLSLQAGGGCDQLVALYIQRGVPVSLHHKLWVERRA